ncbi:MAG: hypothetical protein OXE59_12930 [Bacteroidetes bacterium]|nr:hypothetical protein [Bacteroidota bacterium]
MDLLLNDLSIHEQFHDFGELQRAFGQLIIMHRIAKKYGIDVRSSYYILHCNPMPNRGLSEAINKISDVNLKRAILSWLYKNGPFWEDTQEHHRNDWLECKDETIVTDSSVGEAAYQILHGGDCGLITLAPSNWTYSPVHVTFRTVEPDNSELLTVKNWWVPQELEDDLEKIRHPHRSWRELAEFCTSRFDSLIFFEDSFDPLSSYPFSKPVSSNIEKLLSILDSLVKAHGSKGNRTSKGNRIYRDSFTGARSKFSDSSDTEKRNFRKELTFSDPQLGIHELFCPWHGKINYKPPIRIHCSWPIQSGQSLYVVYIGPKLTM